MVGGEGDGEAFSSDCFVVYTMIVGELKVCEINKQ